MSRNCEEAIVSDDESEVISPQPQNEVLAGREHTIALTPDEQLAFWNALNGPLELTDSQRALGRVMQGES